jgi:RND family efflux transporter MFP subunit
MSALRALVVATIVLGSSSIVSAQQPPTPVRVAEAKLETIQHHQRVTGTLRAVSRAEVAAMEDGRVIEVKFREGDRVKANDTLAIMDDRRLQAQLAEAKAERTVAEAEVIEREAEQAFAQQTLDRAAQLVGRQAISQQEIESREAAARVADARVSSAKRRLEAVDSKIELLNVRLVDCEVKAPFDGQIVARHVEPGEWINPGDPVATLVSDGTIEAWLEVPERFSGQIDRDAALFEIQLSGSGRAISATQIRKILDVNPRSRLFSLIVELPNTDGTLAPGMSAECWLPVGKAAERITVPKDAILRNLQNTFVYQALPAGEGFVATPKPVRILFETGSRVVLDANDLKAGVRVIVEGNERLAPGSPVAITGQETVPAASTAARAKPSTAR